MKQPMLWNPTEDRPGLVRRDHHSTSREAAELVMPRSGSLRKKVLAHVWRAGSAGVTRDEIAAELGMSPNTARPRAKELIDTGWVESCGQTRPTSLGRNAEVLVLTAQGRCEIERIMAGR